MRVYMVRNDRTTCTENETSQDKHSLRAEIDEKLLSVVSAL